MYENRLNSIVITAIDILSIVIEDSLLSVEEYFENKKDVLTDTLFSYFRYGMSLVRDGLSTELMEFVLESEKIKWLQDSSKNSEDLRLFLIIEKLILYIKDCDIERLSEFCCFLQPDDKFSIQKRLHEIRRKM